jgi:hypothetical protein
VIPALAWREVLARIFDPFFTARSLGGAWGWPPSGIIRSRRRIYRHEHAGPGLVF